MEMDMSNVSLIVVDGMVLPSRVVTIVMTHNFLLTQVLQKIVLIKSIQIATDKSTAVHAHWN